VRAAFRYSSMVLTGGEFTADSSIVGPILANENSEICNRASGYL
jgi:hypothetical protein